MNALVAFVLAAGPVAKRYYPNVGNTARATAVRRNWPTRSPKCMVLPTAPPKMASGCISTGSNEFETEVSNSTAVKLIQKTDYPWDRVVQISLELAEQAAFTLRLRTPDSGRGSDLSRSTGRPQRQTSRPARILRSNALEDRRHGRANAADASRGGVSCQPGSNNSAARSP